MKNKVKQIAGVRLTPEASATVSQWAKLTGKSANWISSYAVNSLRGCLMERDFAGHVKEELEALGRVQGELQITDKRISNAKAELAAIRKRKAERK